MHVVHVHLEPFRHNSLLKCAAARNCKKFFKTPYFGGSRSFKVIDIDINFLPLSRRCKNAKFIFIQNPATDIMTD